MYEGDRVCGTKGVAAAHRQSRFMFEGFVEGEEVITPRLQGLVLGDFPILLGVALGEGVRLEEQGGCDVGEKVVRKGEAGALRLFLAVPESVEVLWKVGVLLPQLCE